MKELVELGLHKPGQTTDPEPTPPNPSNPLKSTAEAFLKIFADCTPQAEDKDIENFKRALEDLRAEIGLSSHDQEIRRLAANGVKICEQFLKRSRTYHATREADLAEMIDVFRAMAKHLAGESTDFGVQMRETTSRFHGLAQLDDIGELKKNLTQEANALQKIIEAKIHRDQQTLSALNERIESLQADLSEAEEQASIDPLSKVANRLTFDRSLTRMVNAVRTSKAPLSLAMIDIDHFKKINDTYGHPIGDRVLLCAAQWLTAAIRHTDLVARYGGEEFAVILADADLASAAARFQTVTQQIAGRSFEYDVDGETRSIRFTVSCGIAQLTGSESERDLVHRADQALYDAKRGGRNCVVARKRSKLSTLLS